MPTNDSSGNRGGPPITFTLDVEDHRPNDRAELRFEHLTREVLEFLAEREIVGTFFIVASLAADHAGLVRAIGAGGHEIAMHAWRHVPITSMSEDEFRRDTAGGKDALEQITQNAVIGYRAPTYSLTPAVAWAPDVLAELGFEYSSSVMPGNNPLFSWPGVREEPFLWPSGLVEFPGFLYGVGPARLPMFGGVYGRVLPMWFLRKGFASMARSSMAHLYCHPYDFDPGERYFVVPDAGPFLSPLLWVGRRRWYSRVAELMSNPAPPFRDRLSEARLRATTFNP